MAEKKTEPGKDDAPAVEPAAPKRSQPMPEPVEGGRYRLPDGSFVDANGKPLKD